MTHPTFEWNLGSFLIGDEKRTKKSAVSILYNYLWKTESDKHLSSLREAVETCSYAQPNREKTDGEIEYINSVIYFWKTYFPENKSDLDLVFSVEEEDSKTAQLFKEEKLIFKIGKNYKWSDLVKFLNKL